MISAKHEWSKSYIIRPRDNIISHVHLRNPRIFKPSYELEDCPIPMNWLMGWEYARIWLKERDSFVQDRVKQSKPKFIKNNYEKWIEIRKPKAYKTCPAQGNKRIASPPSK